MLRFELETALQIPIDFVPLLRSVLTRLVRIALACGFTYQSFNRVLRRVYFEVATDFERVRGKSNSDSRIAVLTGMPRREVRSLREQDESTPTTTASVETRVLERWTSSLDFLDEQGAPLPLHLTTRRGGLRSFEALVASVNKDVRSRALLDEWLRRGSVLLDEQDRVLLAHRSHQTDANGAARILGHVVHDLLAGFDRRYLVGASNEAADPMITVTGHGLSADSIGFLRAKAQEGAIRVMLQVNRLLVERETADAGQPDAWNRFTFSFLLYHADQRDEPGALNVNPPVEPSAKP